MPVFVMIDPLRVMAGLVPAIHGFWTLQRPEDVDARHKAGHDESRICEGWYYAAVRERRERP